MLITKLTHCNKKTNFVYFLLTNLQRNIHLAWLYILFHNLMNYRKNINININIYKIASRFIGVHRFRVHPPPATRLPTPETAFSLCAGTPGNGGQGSEFR